jgi:hypothetical protein
VIVLVCPAPVLESTPIISKKRICFNFRELFF